MADFRFDEGKSVRAPSTGFIRTETRASSAA